MEIVKNPIQKWEILALKCQDSKLNLYANCFCFAILLHVPWNLCLCKSILFSTQRDFSSFSIKEAQKSFKAISDDIIRWKKE